MQQMGSIPSENKRYTTGIGRAHAAPLAMLTAHFDVRIGSATARASVYAIPAAGRIVAAAAQPERVRAGVRLPHSSNVSGKTLSFAPDLRAGVWAGQRNPTAGQSWRKVATVPRPRESPNRARGSPLWTR